MVADKSRSGRSRSSYLHPGVYKILTALGIWAVLAAWTFWHGPGYAGLALGVVTLFFVISMTLPRILGHIWRTARRQLHDAPLTDGRSFDVWSRGEFETAAGPVKGWLAAAEILLPFIAVAVGMTVFAIIEHFAA
ncbi:MAG TPA: hypothetical protein VKZ79_09035 [Alphaproteobacteria bacterium]|nr:hypothetical protein [Alphaproteobacteria bacterium]